MWLFVLIISLFLFATFPVNSQNGEFNSSMRHINSTSIFELLKSNECNLQTDGIANLKHLCSMPILDLNEIKIKSDYDATPLLCFGLHRLNEKICNITKSINRTTIGIPNENEQANKFGNITLELRNKYKNVTTLCNVKRLWDLNFGSTDSKRSFNPIDNYFTEIISNQSSCQRLCSSIVDGKTADLCIIILTQQELLINLMQPPDSTLDKVSDSLEPRPSLSPASKEKYSEVSAESNTTKYNGTGIKQILDNNAQRIAQKINTETVPNFPQSAGRKFTDPSPPLKSDLTNDNDQKLFNEPQKSEPVIQDKPVEKLDNINGDEDLGYDRVEGGINGNPQENIEAREEDNLDKSVIQNNDLPNNDKSDFTDIRENKKNIDSDNSLMAQPFENQQESDVNAFRRDRLIENEDSHFLTYFVSMGIVCGIMYILFHNKKKILALAVEGRRGRHHGGNRRRPNTASYSKLDSNLEEAMVSNVSQASVTHVLY